MTQRFEFSDFVIDGEARELRRNGRAVQIEPKAFELLLLLASRPGHAFSKDEIGAELWPGRIISDSVISQCVRKARDATGDTASEQSVIKTVHGTGYRFVAKLVGDRRPESVPATRPVRILLATAAIIALAAAYWFSTPGSEPRGQVIVAVLPVEASGGLEDDLASGLESLLTRGISEHSPVQVISSTQSRQMLELLGLAPSDDNPSLLAALHSSMGAEYLLRPTIQDMDGSYQVRAILVDNAGHSNEIAPPEGDIVAMVRGFSRSLADELGVDWSELKDGTLLSEDNFVNEAYARGLRAALTGDNRSAASLFQSVLQLEPELAWARYELGFAQWQLGQADLARQQFETALQEARGRDNSRLAGHALTMLGVLAWQGGALEEAERLYTQALENYRLGGDEHAAASALGNLGILAENRGEMDLAADFYLQARERFAAVHDQVGESAVHTNLAILNRLRGRLHEARARQSKAVEIQQRLGIGSMLVRSLTHLASIERELGGETSAGRLLDEAETLARQYENRHGLADIELERARRALDRLQPDTAATHAESARTAYAELEIAASEVAAMTLLAESALLADNPASAVEWLDRADQVDQGFSKPRERAFRGLLRARAQLDLGRRDEARHQLDHWLPHSDPAVTAQALSVLGDIHWNEEEHNEAIRTWRQALGVLEHVDEPMVRERIRTRLARALIDQKQLDEADRLLVLVEDWNREDVAARIQRARLHLARTELPEAQAVLSSLLDAAEETPRDPELETLQVALRENLS